MKFYEREHTMDFELFNEEYNKQIHEQWENLINGRPVKPGVVRPEVLEVWEDCIKNGIDPYRKIEDEFLTPQEYSAILAENKVMCNIARPFMQNLYDNIPGPASFVILFDKNCVPIAQIYNAEAYSLGILKDILNADRPVPSVRSFYGNITDTLICRRYKKPYYCYGEEHFAADSKNSLCSSAPIMNDDGELLGILTISVDLKYAHWHTMGMILSATKAIEDEIRLHAANEHNLTMATQLAATIESTPWGILVLDSSGHVNNINSCARQLLFLEGEELLGKHVSEILADGGDTFKDPILYMPEQEITLKTKKGNIRYFMTIKKFSPENMPEERDFTLIIIKEHEYAKTLSNHVTNSYSRFSFDDIEGKSKALTDTVNLAKIAAKSDSTVLITGPSGTGKELFAHSIHSASSRRSGPFISVNCGALPAGLVESELFGYEKGAFTGAKKEGQIGKFELANHGTIFLDEIGEMPLSVQASVLRVLESKEVTRIGGSNTNVLDIRIIAATNKDLPQAVKDKEFREDLYYRLNVLPICIPALKERRDDIPLLAKRFLKIYGDRLKKTNLSISDDAYAMLKQYDYPGNVRELENIIERAVNICEPDSVITPDILRFFISMDQSHEDDDSSSEPVQQDKEHVKPGHTIKDVEKELIIEALRSTGGSVTKAAEITGMGRRTLYRKFEEYNINYTDFRNR